MSLDDYASAEANAIVSGERLVAPEMLLDRWAISKKELLKFINGTHPSGVHLPAPRFGSKTVRFRLADVVQVEHALYCRDSHR